MVVEVVEVVEVVVEVEVDVLVVPVIVAPRKANWMEPLRPPANRFRFR
jgi:hypothetical protein